MPARPLLLLALALVAGCGAEPPRERALAPVRLTIDAPADGGTVDDATVEVSGRVWPPGTPVLVAGDEAGVSGERFSAVVALAPGANVVDVAAGAPRRPAAATAVRVTRRLPVEVPDLDGASPEEAERRLAELGLTVEFERGGGLLDPLVPGDAGVCGTDPEAGASVRAGSSVTVEVANVC